MTNTQGGIGRRSALFLAAFVLLAAFFIALYHLQRESLGHDEAWTVWAISGSRLRESMTRIAGDIHPPLYFMLMDGWTALAGQSVYALRLPSTLFALLSLAGTYAVGTRLFDRRIGLLAVVILCTASFFLYYAREVQLYSLALALSVLATVAYLRWLRHPDWRSILLYALLMVALLYTHYYGLLVILAHASHAMISSIRRESMRKRSLRAVLPYVLAFALLAPWLPALVSQIRNNPQRSLPTDIPTVSALLLVTTSGHWALLAAPFALGHPLPRLRRHRRSLALVLFWLLLTPMVVFALNIRDTPNHQLRSMIAILPAEALLVAYGLSQMRLPITLTQRFPRAEQALMLAFAAWIVYAQLTMYPEFWPQKPRWNDSAEQMAQVRQPLEPVITDFAPQSPAAYYDRVFGFRRGIALDLGWRNHTVDEMRDYVALLERVPSIWAVLPPDKPESWDALAALDAEHGVGYRDSVLNLIFYRLDRGRNGDLQFRFADLLGYDGAIAEKRDARVGDSLCVDAPLTALSALDGSYAAGLRLVARANTLTELLDLPLGNRAAGQTFILSGCLDFTLDSSSSDYHLLLTVFNTINGQRLPLLEGDTSLHWGEALVLATIRLVN